jgi:DUF1680 family protein
MSINKWMAKHNMYKNGQTVAQNMNKYHNKLCWQKEDRVHIALSINMHIPYISR